MRRNIFLSVVIASALGFFLASCSGFKQMEIDKRHYRNGFYMHHAGKTSTAALDNVTTPSVDAITSAPAVAVPTGETTANTVVPVQKHATTIAVPAHSASVNANPVTTNDRSETKPNAKNDKLQLPLTMHRDHLPTNAADDGMLIIEIILCLLALPWLAVLIHEGELNNRFWICLLLWFLLILPGVIYGLLVCLDAI